MWLTLALACTGTPAVDTGPEPVFTSSLPVSSCGLAPYSWLSEERMGEIVAVEALDEATMSAELIDGLLKLGGLEVLTPVPYGVTTWRIRYLTQDKGQLVEATGLVHLPTVDEDQTFDVVAWMHPTMGFNDACAPSAGPLENWMASGLLASLGYAVVAPDYLGMAGWGEPSGRLHPYVVPEPTAVASLDSIRAFQRLGASGDLRGTDAKVGERVMLWGASEGGFAALWSDRYAPGYAPELDIVGVIAAVPPTDLTGLAQAAVAEPIDATGGLVGVLAASWVWHDRPGSLSSFLTDQEPTYLASTLEDTLLSECRPGNLLNGATTMDDIFQTAFIEGVSAGDWEGLGELGCMLQEGDLRASAVPYESDAPVLLIVGEEDELVVGYTVRADAPRLCDAGYVIDYRECAGEGHVAAAANTLLDQMDWVADRFAGEALPATCVIGDPVACPSPL